MKKHSLRTTGLSMTQAQSVSNLCNQYAKEVERKLVNINNSSQEFSYQGDKYSLQDAYPMPENIVQLLEGKAAVHALQAFLMENIKAKDTLLTMAKEKNFMFLEKLPVQEEIDDVDSEDLVDENWGWNQLSVEENNEYLEAEAFASHLGQFIHKNGKLSALRDELPTLKSTVFTEIEAGKKRPVKVTKHHTEEDLFRVHDELSQIHRQYEQRVNYFKAKVKNLVSAENVRRTRDNAKKFAEYREKESAAREKYMKLMADYKNREKIARESFEEERATLVNELSKLRIKVPTRFQPTLDKYLGKVTEG